MYLSASIRALLSSFPVRLHGVPSDFHNPPSVTQPVQVVKQDGKVFEQWVITYTVDGYSEVLKTFYSEALIHVKWRRLLKQSEDGPTLRKIDGSLLDPTVYGVDMMLRSVFNLEESDTIVWTDHELAEEMVRLQGYQYGLQADLDAAKEAILDELAAAHKRVTDAAWEHRRQRQIGRQEP